MENAIAKIENNGSSLMVLPKAPEQVVLNSDIIIPKLLLMQGLSVMVAEEKQCPISGQQIIAGKMVRSTTGEILGDSKNPLRFIPLKMVSSWILQEKIGGKFEFRGIEPRTAANEMLPWEFTQNGAEWRRVKTLDVFALLPRDVEAFRQEMMELEDGEMPDLNKTVLPVVISFRSTSFNAGKGVATHYAQIAELKKLRPDLDVKHYGYSLELSCFGDKNDKGSYYVFKVGASKKVDQKLMPIVESWAYTINSMPSNIKVDEEAEATVGEQEVPHF